MCCVWYARYVPIRDQTRSEGQNLMAPIHIFVKIRAWRNTQKQNTTRAANKTATTSSSTMASSRKQLKGSIGTLSSSSGRKSQKGGDRKKKSGSRMSDSQKLARQRAQRRRSDRKRTKKTGWDQTVLQTNPILLPPPTDRPVLSVVLHAS